MVKENEKRNEQLFWEKSQKKEKNMQIKKETFGVDNNLPSKTSRKNNWTMSAQTSWRKYTSIKRELKANSSSKDISLDFHLEPKQ